LNSLAILGGPRVRENPFPPYKVMGEEEARAVQGVMETGILSRYLGTWHRDFYGGPQVQAFESEWGNICDVKHAMAVNSCTSGLYAAIGAAGVGPGDEVICSPYTMVASATAPMIFNAVPVFADIDTGTYNLTAETIRSCITPRTKAIIVVHILGQSADMDPIMALAEEHGLIVIEDCAQAPFIKYKGRPVGKLGHMGVFSFNYHKHIHTGEGGMVTTDDDDLAERVQLIRNHAEAVVEGKGVSNLVNMIGFNFRLGEIEAAIGRAQLIKGPQLIAQRQDNVRYLEDNLQGLRGLSMPVLSDGCGHAYYVHAMKYDASETGVSRDLIVQALKAELPVTTLREGEGTLIGQGYAKPIYLIPMFQKMVGYGDVQCPFKCPHYEGTAEYKKGICPNAEEAHFETLIFHELMRPGMTRKDLDDVIQAFHKVFDNIDELQSFQAKS